jgi:serine/threonine protein phosphatase PrpC
MAQTNLSVGTATDVGQRRDHNEDAFVTFEAEDGAVVLVVADGMGGHLAGEIASAIAIEVLQRELVQPAADPAGTLKAAVELANEEIWAEAERDPEKTGMGSTIVVAIVVGNQAYLANAGDSPAYLVRGGQAEQITHDHGLVAEQIAAGLIRAEDADHHPFRHILTRCLGAEASVEVELYPPRELQDGDVLVLCSDGLTEHVKTRELGPMVTASDTTEIAQGLVDVANQRGGHDNITVVVARAGQPRAEDAESDTVTFDFDEAATTQMVLPPSDATAPTGQ